MGYHFHVLTPLLRPQYHTVPYTYFNVGPGQDVPGRENVIFHVCTDSLLPEYIPNLGVPQGNQGNDYAPQGVVPGPAQATLPGPSAHRAPVLGQPAAENLRRLASRCVHHPDSQVDVVRMEPGTGGRYKVVIVLEVTDFL